MGREKAGLYVSRKARSDLAEIAAYYGRESLDLELAFLSAMEQAFDQIAATPRIGVRREYLHPTMKSLRFWCVPHFFNILIFYREHAGTVEIVRLLHSSRDIDFLLYDPEEE